MLAQEWLFGGVERATNGAWKVFIEPVADRSSETLLEIIRRRIAPGTRIISDGWQAYRTLGDLGYIHEVVIHEDNFADPEDSTINTQRVENFWMLLKRFICSKGTNHSPHNWEYICEFIFRKLFPDTFQAIIDGFRTRYPL